MLSTYDTCYLCIKSSIGYIFQNNVYHSNHKHVAVKFIDRYSVRVKMRMSVQGNHECKQKILEYIILGDIITKDIRK